jgi:cell pole-organizing protein PopZ
LSGQAAQGGAAADPSMEDILASIRRILSEDEGGTPVSDAGAPAAAAPAPAATAAHVAAAVAASPGPHTPDEGEVLALDASMMVAEPAQKPPAHDPQPAVPHVDQISHQTEPTTAGAMPALEPAPAAPEPPQEEKLHPEPERAARHAGDTESLVAPEAMSAAATAMGPLLRKIAADRSQAVYRGGPTLEDIVREEMRPLLKQWLDTNLPATVERLVRAEIERVVNSAVT